MFKLRLNARHCICCGICMDLCPQRAIEMRLDRAPGLEGRILAVDFIPNGQEDSTQQDTAMMTFPFLAHPDQCDGCRICTRECPVHALKLRNANGQCLVTGCAAAASS